MKSLILSLLILAGLSKAADVNISGQIDLSQTPRSATVSVVTSTGLVGNVSQDGKYTITGTTNLSVKTSQKDSPKISWKTFGKELQITGTNNSENYTVDAWTIDGKSVGVRVPFQNGIAKFPTSSEKVFVRLNHSGNSMNVASRRLVDSTLGTVYFIVNDPSNGVVNDTLVEIPVTNWIGVLGPKYIVGRNVDVTVPNAFVGDTVKVGWFNVYTNPSNYYSTVLGRSYSGSYSGFVYTAYDSASFGNNSYLYSAVSIIKHGDSVVAFSKDLDTVTAKVGNFKFDSSRFVTKILSDLDTTLTIPWYAFSLNGTSVSLYSSVVKHLDSVVTFDTITTKEDTTGMFFSIYWQKVETLNHDTSFEINDTIISKKLFGAFIHEKTHNLPDTLSISVNDCGAEELVYGVNSSIDTTIFLPINNGTNGCLDLRTTNRTAIMGLKTYNAYTYIQTSIVYAITKKYYK